MNNFQLPIIRFTSPIFNEYVKKKSTRINNSLNDFKVWIRENGTGNEITPELVRKFLNQYSLEGEVLLKRRPLMGNMTAVKKQLPIATGINIKRFIYYCCHNHKLDFTEEQISEFNNLRKNELSKYKEKKINAIIAESDIEKLYIKVCSKEKPSRVELIIQFLHLTKIGITTLCNIKLVDIQDNDEGYNITIRPPRTKGIKTIAISNELFLSIKHTFTGELYLFETMGHGIGPKRGHQQLDRSYVCKQIKNYSFKNIGKVCSPKHLREKYF